MVGGSVGEGVGRGKVGVGGMGEALIRGEEDGAIVGKVIAGGVGVIHCTGHNHQPSTGRPIINPHMNEATPTTLTKTRVLEWKRDRSLN